MDIEWPNVDKGFCVALKTLMSERTFAREKTHNK